MDYILDFQTLLYNLRAQTVEVVVDSLTAIQVALEQRKSYDSQIKWLLTFLKNNENPLRQRPENIVRLLQELDCGKLWPVIG